MWAQRCCIDLCSSLTVDWFTPSHSFTHVYFNNSSSSCFSSASRHLLLQYHCGVKHNLFYRYVNVSGWLLSASFTDQLKPNECQMFWCSLSVCLSIVGSQGFYLWVWSVRRASVSCLLFSAVIKWHGKYQNIMKSPVMSWVELWSVRESLRVWDMRGEHLCAVCAAWPRCGTVTAQRCMLGWDGTSGLRR